MSVNRRLYMFTVFLRELIRTLSSESCIKYSKISEIVLKHEVLLKKTRREENHCSIIIHKLQKVPGT